MRRILLILTALSSAASISLKWTESMYACKTIGQGPASVADEVKPRDRTWLGRAEYIFDWGNVSLRIEMVDKNRTCYDCNDASSKKNCEICVLEKWIISLETLKQAIGYLKSDRLYIVANFSDIKALPEPYLCLSKKGSNAATYDSCNEIFDDGCAHQESAACRGHLLLKIIVTLLVMSLLRVEEGYQ
uniref:Uncharacterized protein LOC111133649 isoform X2 n=1 Tax=Crassostrea virginica TaxID=6565 RepID=A0A8B8ECP2_CRAVI|nr:uncharacterized protein LOC111133649 isoform X2 [Crassostrea virginica]